MYLTGKQDIDGQWLKPRKPYTDDDTTTTEHQTINANYEEDKKRYRAVTRAWANFQKRLEEYFPEQSLTHAEKFEKVESVSYSFAYWRKANAIHKWFVDNCGDGKDECQPIPVYYGQLVELYHTCNRVIEQVKLEDGKIHMGTKYQDGERIEIYKDGKIISNPEICMELLPTQEGFFFGSTDYDEYYLETLKDTISQLEPIIKNQDQYKYMSFTYQASW